MTVQGASFVRDEGSSAPRRRDIGAARDAACPPVAQADAHHPATLLRMSRADPERIAQARRSALFRRLVDVHHFEELDAEH